MVTSLDPRWFPHILENIIFHSVWETQLAARLVSSSMRDLADRVLIGPDLYLRSGHPSCALLVETYTQGGRNRYTKFHRVPCLHGTGNVRSQRDVMRRVRRIRITLSGETPRVPHILSLVQPTSHIDWVMTARDHTDLGSVRDQIPPCESLHLSSEDYVCHCRVPTKLGARKLRHTASTVKLTLPYQYDHDPTYCFVIAGALNSSVTRFTLAGSFRNYPDLVANTEIKIHPDLQIFLRCWGDDDWDLVTSPDFSHKLARCLNISVGRIQTQFPPWE